MGKRDEFVTGENVYDIRDIIARYEYIEDSEDSDEIAERDMLKAILDDLSNRGGDEEWRSAWYPITLIAESYFTEYAQELAEDVGDIKKDATWPYTHIDWDAAAHELKGDYCVTEIDGDTYYFR